MKKGLINLKPILGKSYRHIEVADSIIGSFPQSSYRLYTEQEFATAIKANPQDASKIQFEEFLCKCEIASIAALNRTFSWLRGIEQSLDDYILFASSLRGLMESSGDIYKGFDVLALSIADNYKEINDALNGNFIGISDTSALDEMVDHFLFATRGLGKQQNKTELEPLSAKKYIQALEEGSSVPFYDIYGELCQFVHPAGHSLAINFETAPIPSKNNLMYKGIKRDKVLIDSYLKQHPLLLDELLMRSFNPVIVLLKTLNFFTTPIIHTPNLDHINLNNIPAWRKIEKKIKK